MFIAFYLDFKLINQNQNLNLKQIFIINDKRGQGKNEIIL